MSGFMQPIMEKIWEPVTEIYTKAYEQAMAMDAYELYRYHTEQTMRYYHYVGVTMNYVDTLGCPYRGKGKKLAGCSMCDFQSELAQQQGSLKALQEKDPELYAKSVLTGFKNARGSQASANVIENISGYDTFSQDEVPSPLLDELFGKEMFHTNPFIFNVEARASSITRDNLKRFRESIKNKKRVSIDFGVETGNEWIRNQWLNKNVSNAQIMEAIQLLHEYGFKAVCNVLIGIPGLTEQQSISSFLETMLWLDSIGADKIIIHILSRKTYTLQGFMYQKFQNDQELWELGLAQGEHTGLPWLITAYRALSALYARKSDIYEKAAIVRLDENYNSITNKIAFNDTESCDCNQAYRKFINDLTLTRRFELLEKSQPSLECDSCLRRYNELLIRQEKAGGIWNTARIWAEKITRELFGETDHYELPKWEECDI